MRSGMGVLAVAALGALVSAVPAGAGTVEASVATAFAQAERDFDATLAETALSGSAPLAGLELKAPVAAGRKASASKKQSAKAAKGSSKHHASTASNAH